MKEKEERMKTKITRRGMEASGIPKFHD